MSIFDIIQSLLPLVVIIVLLGGVLYFVKKYSYKLNSKKSKALNVDVIYNHLLMPKKYISFVKLQDKVLVLGISESNITLLKEIDYDSLDDDFIVEDAKSGFIDILKQNMGMR
ncbi:MAG: flagellar biosynthetic protein FliO [Melioribacteraceae bacterium]|nr:flagellar biosynthetic protein FliO [Melioribacteraceae bacterium]